MFNKKIILLLPIILFGLFFVLSVVSAQTGPYIGLEYGAETKLGGEDIRYTVIAIIRVLLGLLGTISLIIILYAGFKWMTSGGNEEDVTSAKKILIAAIIGLTIILTSYAITRFVTYSLFRATKGYSYSAVEF